jgi:hypothetical protein
MSIATVVLVMACSSDRSTEPSATGSASTTLSGASTSVFVTEPTLMTVPTYDGSGQSVHPDVVAFGASWHGAKYWLTMTPYPKSDQKLENPSILMSEDGVSVSVPAGLKNPVFAPPRSSRNYNSDPELLYEPQTDRLVLFDRLVEKGTNTILVSTSRDGVKWTAARSPFWEHDHQVVSPTVAPRMGAPARMWYVNAGKKGCDAPLTSVMTRVGADQNGRFVDTRWIGPVRTDLSIPGYAIWHIKARWIPEKAEYWMLLSAYPLNKNGCRTDDLFYARSADGVHWTTYAEPILHHEERNWTAAAVYRSTFLYDAESDELSMWISARGDDGAWRIGYARARYASLLETLENGLKVSPRLTTVFRTTALQRGEEP